MSKNTVEILLSGNSSKLSSALSSGAKGIKSFGSKARTEFDAIKRAAGSIQGKLAGLGISVGAAMLMKQSALLDKSLIQIGQTAGETKAKVSGLRKELFDMAKETGSDVDDLKQGFNNAVQSGLNFKEALPVVGAVNKAMAVTGADAVTLTSGLTVAAKAFQFDLAKPGMALLLLDKMIVAGRAGRAELQNLSDIFARVGVNARDAGMGFEQTLAFIEGLSLVDESPERLATLADSTLRLFTRLDYMRKAKKTTGINFFDDKGKTRDPLKVLADIKKKYDLIKTEEGQRTWFGKVFEGADAETIKGLRTLLAGSELEKIGGEFTLKISKASGTIKRDLPEAINNAIDQTGRLRAEMRRVADDFIKPLNAGISKGIKKLLDSKKEGGMGFSGEKLALGAIGIGAASFAAYRYGGKAIKSLIGTGAGIVEGKILEAETGITPVFVTNFPPSMGGISDGIFNKVGKFLMKIPGAGKIAAATPWLLAGGATLTTAATLTAVAGANAGYQALTNKGGKNWISESLAMKGWYGDKLYDLFHGGNTPEIKNNMNIYIDRHDRAIVETQGMKNRTVVNLKRGGLSAQ